MENWKNRTLLTSKNFKPSRCTPTQDGLAPSYLILRMDDLSNLDKAKKIKKQVAWFAVLNEELYKRGFLQPYLRCVEEEEAKYVLEEVHRGIYDDHMGAKSLVRKIMRVGYF